MNTIKETLSNYINHYAGEHAEEFEEVLA